MISVEGEGVWTMLRLVASRCVLSRVSDNSWPQTQTTAVVAVDIPVRGAILPDMPNHRLPEPRLKEVPNPQLLRSRRPLLHLNGKSSVVCYGRDTGGVL